MSRDEIDEEAYEWLTQRFGERVAEALVPCPGHAWPLTIDEQKTAHAHYERWANQQEGDMSELSMVEYEQDCKPLMPMASTLDKLRGVVLHPFGYGVMDKTCLDLEVYTTREDAIERARECHSKYPRIGPFRVVKITLEPLKDDDDSDQREVSDRETLTERRAEEAERRIRAESEGTP